jgi:hypothetical protein
MIKNIKKLVLGISAALALLASPAGAATYGVNVGAPLAVTVGTSFVDHFNFTLNNSSPSYLLGGAATSSPWVLDFPAPLPDMTIDAVTFTGFKLYQGIFGVGGATEIWSSPTLSTSNASYSWSLLAGNYYFEVTGTHPGPFGAYAVALQAAPVPEPQEWAMMLAGLGIVSAVARRRMSARPL